MKNKNATLRVIIGLLVAALIILTVAPPILEGRDPLPGTGGTYYGQWLYDSSGGHIGCKSPGSDCTWG